MTRRLSVVLLFPLLILVALSSCNKKLADADRVRQFMAATEAKSRAFVYTERSGEVETVVKGAIADDFRYKALASMNGTAAFDEVVSDDAVADRLLDQQGIDVFARKVVDDPSKAGGSASQTGSPSTAGDQQKVIAALNAKRWVLDPAGAPTLLPAANDKRRLGDDPIFDAMTVFRYVDQAMNEAFAVIKFNPDSLSYKPKEDPFPRPKPGSGVVRYDLVRRSVPRQQQQVNGNAAVPAAGDFRKMSIYVKDGLVIQVLEDMDVVSRLGDLTRNYNIKLDTSRPSEAVKAAMDAINAVRRGQGSDEIRVRTMSLQLVDIGKAQDVELPSDAITGSLTLLENRGKVVRKGTST